MTSASPGLVVDSSALVALLVDGGELGEWVDDQVRGRALAAPALAPYEVANVVRRRLVAQLLSEGEAALVLRDLDDLVVQLWPYDVTAARAWELRHELTSYDACYDACYVALAELLEAELVTLDRRVTRVRSVRCAVRVPPEPRPGD